MKRLLAPFLLAAAVLVVAVLASETRLGRMATVSVPTGTLPEVYVQSKTGDAAKCLVADRAGVTARRSEPTLTGTRWKCTWPTGPSGALAALSGKNPSWLFVPFEDVVDPVHPLLWEAVREASKARGDFVDGDVRDGDARDAEDPPEATEEPPPLDASASLLLPRIRWVQLSVDRRFRGLFLEVRLPGKRFGDNRALGRVEMLAAGDDTLHCWNRKLKDACTLYTLHVAEGWWPEPAWRDDTAWLASLLERADDAAGVSRSFALAERAVPSLVPWPLPLSLSSVLGETSAKRWSDPRFASWSVASRSAASSSLPSSPRSSPPSSPPSSLALALAAEAPAIERRIEALDATLEAHCRTRGCDVDRLRARLAASRSKTALDRLAGGVSARTAGEG